MRPHIDWVLKSLEEHPEVWGAAIDAARGAAWNAAWDAARNVAQHTAMDAARHAAWNAAWSAAWIAARGAAWSAATDAARHAMAALIADDDCSHLYKFGLGHTKCVHALNNHFSSLLLQPAAYVWSKIHGTE